MLKATRRAVAGLLSVPVSHGFVGKRARRFSFFFRDRHIPVDLVFSISIPCSWARTCNEKKPVFFFV